MLTTGTVNGMSPADPSRWPATAIASDRCCHGTALGEAAALIRVQIHHTSFLSRLCQARHLVPGVVNERLSTGGAGALILV